MPLETFDQLCTKIADQIARPDLADVAPDWLYIAELEAAREFDLAGPERRIFGEIEPGADHVELPPDYLDLRWVQLQTTPARELRSSTPADRLRAQSDGRSGYPTEGMVTGNKLLLTPTSGASRYEMLYQAGPEHLGAKVAQTYLSRAAGDYLLYTACLHAAPYINAGARLQEWIFFQKRAEDSTRRQLWNAKFAGGPMAIRSDRGQP